MLRRQQSVSSRNEPTKLLTLPNTFVIHTNAFISNQEFLGQGSFGFVTMVWKKEGVMQGALFALKSLSKLGVVEGGQVQHIKDEKTVSVPS